MLMFSLVTLPGSLADCDSLVAKGPPVTCTGAGAATSITTLKLIDPQNGIESNPHYLEMSLADLDKGGLLGFLAFK